jgi:hypothetical protein
MVAFQFYLQSGKQNGRVGIGKHLSDSFPVQNSLKQGDAILPCVYLTYFIFKLYFYVLNLQLGFYSVTIGNMSGRSQVKLVPGRNTLGKSAEHSSRTS